MKLNQAFKLSVVAGENMLINVGDRSVNKSVVFSLNEPAAWLWNKIGSSDFTEGQLVKWLCEEYDVSEDVAVKDVCDMVRLWRGYGMIRPDDV